MGELLSLIVVLTWFGGPAVAWGFIFSKVITPQGATPNIVLFWVVLICMELILIILFRSLVLKCPKCGKLYALKEFKRITLDKRYTTVTELRKNYHGQGTHEESVLATEYTDRVYYKCQYCGYEKDQIEKYIIK